MKKHLLTLTIAFLVLSGGKTFAQCNASFTWSQSQPNVIDFVNTSAPQNPGSQYWWYYGDTLADYGVGPFQHTYFVPGVYYVTLSVFDSVSQTSCQFLDTITVTGSVLCNINITMTAGLCSCPSCADGNADVTNIIGGTAPYTYLWNNGGTTQSITGILPGIYSCCVTDAAGCVVCDSVTLSSNTSTSCNISTTVTTPAPGWINAEAFLNFVSSSTTVSWDFGDLTTGSGMNVFHQYAQSGSYNVCATVTDALTLCTDTYCSTVNVVVPSGCSAGFLVQPSSNPNQALIYNLSIGSSSMTYQWDWGDQTPFSTGPFPSHTYQSTGSYWITLVVTDPVTQCVDSAYQQMWVPRLTQEASLAPYTVYVVSPVPTGISESDAVSSWILFPNPANEVLNIQGGNSSDQYVITDLAGRTVLSGTLLNNSVNVSALSGGAYFFTLVKENGVTESKRFIRE